MIALARRLLQRVAPLRYSANWSRGGAGWVKQWKLIGQLFCYRRTEDQHWSPHLTERRTEYGLTINSSRNCPLPTLAVITTRRIFFDEPQGHRR